MTNTIIVSGIVLKQWMHGKDRFLRLAVPRAPGLPAKSIDDVRSNGRQNDRRRYTDYVSVRIPENHFGGLPVTFQNKQWVHVVGYLQSRDYDVHLGTFLKRAQGDKPELPDSFDVTQLKQNRSTTEVVAESMYVIKHPTTVIIPREQALAE